MRWHLARVLAACVLAAGVLGCEPECIDRDGDGFGRNCPRGDDCDDTLASRNVDCSEPAPDCRADPFQAGCTCRRGERRACYDAPAETAEVGVCRQGEQRCAGGSWTECMNAVQPRPEQCNEVDDDCDGDIDEGVRSPCGGCDAECVGAVWGEGDAPFVAAPEAGVAVSPRGELLLHLHPLETTSVVVPNTGEGTVSIIDSTAVRERARYRTRSPAPTAVAIDYQTDAFILGETQAGAAALSRIATDPERCVDRDGDGLQTSSGPGDVLAQGQDDCVLLELDLDTAASALVVSGQSAPDQDDASVVWVGLRDEHALLALHGVTGQHLQRIELGELAPYAATFDPFGTLWVIDRDGLLAAIEPTLDPPTVRVIEAQLRCYLLESIASDERGVLTLAGAECESLTRYDPLRDRWDEVDTPGVLDARHVAALSDESWVTHTAGRVSRVTHAPLRWAATYSLGGGGLMPFDSSAISPDDDGHLWIVSSAGAAFGNGTLTRFEQESGRVSAQVPVGFLPRPSGDLTGARRYGRLVPSGTSSHIFTGCSGGEPLDQGDTQWQAVHVAGVVGSSSSVAIDVRRADTRAQLAQADFIRVGELPLSPSPLPLSIADGGLIELRATLQTRDYHGGPRVARIGVQWRCPGPD